MRKPGLQGFVILPVRAPESAAMETRSAKAVDKVSETFVHF